MSAVLEALAKHAARRPQAPALAGTGSPLAYEPVHRAVLRMADHLDAFGVRVLGLIADNGPAWVIADLAAIEAGVCLVPLPGYFSPRQMAHALRAAGADAVLVDPRFQLPQEIAIGQRRGLLTAGAGIDPLELLRLIPPVGPRPVLPPGTRKITFTSGTTGEPRGVCLGWAEMERAAEALCSAGEARADDVHLGVLPLSTLLENIGGVYAPILAGATMVQRPMAEVGLQGATRLDPLRLAAALRDARATTAIFVPQLLLGLVAALGAGALRPDHLRFVAVGGAPVASTLLDRACEAGVPVHEGYGLSECASVVALNRPSVHRRGTVGRPLRHLRVELASDGEVIVTGNGFRGYVGEPPRDASEPVATGDLGAFDDDGYLRLTGRKKNLFITAFGRNVAPEWIESELCAHPAIAQAAVFGEARPWNAAVIVPRPGAGDVDAALRNVNAGLPDYARVHRWVEAHAPFSPDNGQLTANGRVRRVQVAAEYHPQLHVLYEDECR